MHGCLRRHLQPRQSDAESIEARQGRQPSAHGNDGDAGRHRANGGAHAHTVTLRLNRQGRIFEAQVRALAGLPLAMPRQYSPTIMINLLGDLWFDANSVRSDVSEQAVSPPWAEVLALPGSHLHLYGKTSARRDRKMGHLNITGATVAQVRETASQALALLGLPPLP